MFRCCSTSCSQSRQGLCDLSLCSLVSRRVRRGEIPGMTRQAERDHATAVREKPCCFKALAARSRPARAFSQKRLAHPPACYWLQPAVDGALASKCKHHVTWLRARLPAEAERCTDSRRASFFLRPTTFEDLENSKAGITAAVLAGPLTGVRASTTPHHRYPTV